MAKITKHYFENNGRKYFRGNAENIEIGSYGEKKDPIGAVSYVDVQSRVKAEHLSGRVKGLGTVAIDWKQVSKADLGGSGSLNIFGVKGGRAAGASLADAERGRCKLVGFAIDEGKLKSALNTDADGARNYLADEGADGRIASEIWVVMEAEIANAFSASAGYTVTASVAGVGLDISVNGGTASATKVTFSPGSTFAYGLHKVKDWNKGKTRIEDMEADYKGMS